MTISHMRTQKIWIIFYSGLKLTYFQQFKRAAVIHTSRKNAAMQFRTHYSYKIGMQQILFDFITTKTQIAYGED
jgi:hypothetical protein